MSLNVFPTFSAKDLGAMFNVMRAPAQPSLLGTPAVPKVAPAPAPPPLTLSALPALRKPAPVSAQALARQCLQRDVFVKAQLAQAAPMESLLGSAFIARMAEETLAAMDDEMFFARMAEFIASVCDAETLERVASLSKTEEGTLLDDVAITVAEGVARACAMPFATAKEGDLARAYMRRLLDSPEVVPPEAKSVSPSEDNAALCRDTAERCVTLLHRDLEGPPRQAAIDALLANLSSTQLRTVNDLLDSPFGRELCAVRHEVVGWVNAAYAEPELREALEVRVSRLFMKRVLEVAKAAQAAHVADTSGAD